MVETTLRNGPAQTLGLQKSDFESALQAYCHTATGPYLRPFGANSQWQSARVVVIGENPATPLRDEFSGFKDYWHALTHAPERFRAAYDHSRGGHQTKTSRRIQMLVDQVGMHCLVTNVCWYPAPSRKAIPREERGRHTGFLYRLVQFVEPCVLFAHGAKALDFVRQSFGLTIDPYVPASSQCATRGSMLVLGYPHFSGLGIRKGQTFRPEEDIPVFAQRIRSHLERHAMQVMVTP